MKTKDLVVGETYVDKNGRNECVVVGVGVTATENSYTGEVTVHNMDSGKEIVVSTIGWGGNLCKMYIRSAQSLAMTKAAFLEISATQRQRQAEKELAQAQRQAKVDALRPAVKLALEAAGIQLYVPNYAGARIDMDFEQLCKLLKIDTEQV